MSEDFKLQASYKFGPFDQHMLNVRAENGRELSALLSEVAVQEVVEFGSTVKAVQDSAPLTTPTAGHPAPPAVPAPPAAVAHQAEAPLSNGAKTVCDHGPRRRQTGTSARGAWVAWFCPLPKGDTRQCKAEWENDR